jgi:tetratricopeptide (TPR) repeat protein
MLNLKEWLRLQKEGIQSCTDKRYPQAEVTFATALKLVQEAIAQNKAAAKQAGTSTVSSSAFTKETAEEPQESQAKPAPAAVLASKERQADNISSLGELQEPPELHAAKGKTIDQDLQERLAYSLNNLAVSYQLQGKYGLALNQYIESTEIYRKLRGEHSLDFATSLHNLAIVYSAKKEYDQAETLFKRSLEIKEALLEDTNPDLQILKVNMAQMLRKAGKLIEAEKVLHKT